MDLDEKQNLSSPKARGRRLRYIRDDLLKMSRRELHNRYKDLKLTEACIQNWEEARFNGLKEQHVERLLVAFARENIIFDKYWILDGVGKPPRSQNSIETAPEQQPIEQRTLSVISEEEAIAYELRAFHETHVEVIDGIINDDGLAPCYLPGDYVAGVRHVGSAIQQAVGLCCIVQTQQGKVLIRKVEKGSQEGYYSLICTNSSAASITDSTVKDIKLFSVAPIAWWRRPLTIIK